MDSLPRKLFLMPAILIILLAPLGAQQSGQVLSGHVRPAVAEGWAKPLGQMPAAQNMNLSIVLPLRNQDQLRNLLKRLYDPADPMYRKFLSVSEFTDQFGPTEADYQAVVDFAQENGMAVTGRPANRLLVPLSATVEQVQRAFHVWMGFYQHPNENRTFFSPNRNPELPQGLRIAHIAGLNNFSSPWPLHNRPLGSTVASPAKTLGSGPGGSYLGTDMRAAYYGGTELTGSGQAVGLLQFDGYDPNDVEMTFTNSGLKNTVPINNVLLNGATGRPCQFSLWCDDAEQVLDIVQAAEMAPGLAEIRVYIGALDADILNAMASENIAKQLSVSWTWTPDDPAVDDVFFQEMAAQGQSIFVASGDAGAFSPNVNSFFYPAEDDFVTAVGGTTLVTNGGLGPWVSETAWSFSGGGISPDGIPIADWQMGVANAANQGSKTLRNIPDVAMEADFDNYNCGMGRCLGGWAGTSFAAPRWAGFMALVNEQAAQSGSGPIGFLNPALYNIGESPQYNTMFHDVTSGKNDNNGAWPVPYQIFSAVPGYDLVTGWGSPTGQSLIDALAPKPQPEFHLTSSVTRLIIAPGDSGSTTITVKSDQGFSGSVSLSVTGLPDGVIPSWSENSTATSSELTLTVPESAVRGSYLVKVTGVYASHKETASVALVVDAPGFSILPTSSRIVVRAGLKSGTKIVISRFKGFTSPVTLAITSPLPAGVSAVWSGNPAQNHAELTLSASSSAPLASSVLTITATSGNLTATTTVSLVVGGVGFWLSVAPAPSNLTPGGQVTATVMMLPLGDFNDRATLQTDQLPAGITATFSPATIVPGESSVMTLKAAETVALGNYESYAVAMSPTGSGTAGFQYSVTAIPVPSFGFVPSPAELTVQQNQSAVVTLSTVAVNGFTGSINMFGIPQLPEGMTFAYSQNSFPVGQSTQLTITAGPDALPGNYAMGIGGYSGNRAFGATLFVTVIPASSLSLALSPSGLELPQGQSAKITATLTSSPGILDNPTFTVVSNLPQGVSATFQSGQSDGTGVLNFSASYSAPPGAYTLNIAATSGIETVNTPIFLTISKGVSTFSIAATSLTVKPGNSGQSSITLGSTNGYSGTIALSCSVTSSPRGAQSIPTCTAGPNVTLSPEVSNLSTTVTVRTTAATSSAMAQPRSPWGSAGGALALTALACMISPWSTRRFRSMIAILLLTSAAGSMLLIGCGGTGAPASTRSAPPTTAGSPGTTAGTYTLTVTAKGDDSLATRASATFTLTVQ
jgi:hypothetical protein